MKEGSLNIYWDGVFNPTNEGPAEFRTGNDMFVGQRRIVHQAAQLCR